MRVTILVYRPYERKPQVIEFATEPERAMVEATVGGPIEQVPGFFSIDHNGVVRRCVAFCVRDGKVRNLPLNLAATVLWDSALRRDMGVGLIRTDGTRADDLVGSIAILFAERD